MRNLLAFMAPCLVGFIAGALLWPALRKGQPRQICVALLVLAIGAYASAVVTNQFAG